MKMKDLLILSLLQIRKWCQRTNQKVSFSPQRPLRPIVPTIALSLTGAGKLLLFFTLGVRFFFLGGGVILEVRVGGNILEIEGIPRFVQGRPKEGSSYLFNVYLFWLFGNFPKKKIWFVISFQGKYLESFYTLSSVKVQLGNH